MRRIDVEKKRPSPWPWVLGVLLLALVGWGVTTLLEAPAEPEPVSVGTTTPDTLPPALIPSRPAAIGPQAPARLDLAALDEDAVGRTARVEGEVVATGNEALWILSGSHVIRVDSNRRARKGDSIAVRGTVLGAEAELTDRVASEVLSRSAEYDGWTVLRSLRLVEETERQTEDGGDAGS